MRETCAIVLVLIAAAAVSAQQVTPAPSQKFEVTSVKRNLSGDSNSSTRPRTGLSGTFDLTLLWDPDLAGGQGVSVFSAVQEQLGLKLEARRGQVEVLVIDRAEPPTEN